MIGECSTESLQYGRRCLGCRVVCGDLPAPGQEGRSGDRERRRAVRTPPSAALASSSARTTYSTTARLHRCGDDGATGGASSGVGAAPTGGVPSAGGAEDDGGVGAAKAEAVGQRDSD